MSIQVAIVWTRTAKKLLLGLPKNVARGIFHKVGGLRDSDPRLAGKALVGPLAGLRSLTHGRYRVLFSVEEESLAHGVVRLHVTMRVVAVGIRKEHDKRDIYKVAKKLIELGLLQHDNEADDE